MTSYGAREDWLSVPYLSAVFEATADGLLVVDEDGRIVFYNQRFVDIWDIPEEVLEERSDEKALSYAKDRLAEPERFVAGVEAIYEREDAEGSDHLDFADGRTIERYTRPVRREGETIGRVWSFRDVTEHARTVARLEASERRYRTLLEDNVAGVFRTSVDGEILDCNEAFAEILGYGSAAELMDREAPELYASPEERAAFLEELMERGAVENYELTVQAADGQEVELLENSRLIGDPEAEDAEIIGTVIDVTERKRLQERLEAMALHDELTGLPNRRLLAERADQALRLADRTGEQVGLLYLDLVSFKMVNDSLGHTAGDRVLVEAGKRIRSGLRESDTAARVGGDEFVVLLPEVEGREGLEAAADRLAGLFERPFATDPRPVHQEIRLGGALYPDHAGSFDDLLTRADRALTRARTESRAFAFYASDADTAQDRLATVQGLRRALEEDRLRLYYQPVVRLADGEVAGVESLLRWPREDGRVLTAGQLLPLAERRGLIRQLDGWMLRRASRQLAEWDDRIVPGWMGINLSGRIFQEPGLAEEVQHIFEETGADPSRVVVEITEQAALRDPERTRRNLAALREAGIRVAIDDFGTGHSAIAHLKQYPADLLKIDMIFVRGVEPGDPDSELTEALVRLGQTTGAEVVAEGIETAEQRDWIAATSCEYGQGFHLGRPVPAEELELA